MSALAPTIISFVWIMLPVMFVATAVVTVVGGLLRLRPAKPAPRSIREQDNDDIDEDDTIQPRRQFVRQATRFIPQQMPTFLSIPTPADVDRLDDAGIFD